jgi:hypothetical protein
MRQIGEGGEHLAKLFDRFISKFGFKNAPAPKKGGGGGAIQRDPKAIGVKRVGYQISNSQGGGSGRDNFEGPKVDFSVIQTAIERDSYIMQGVMKYEELIFKSGYSYQAKNDQALEYLRLRLEAMAIATGVQTEELWHGIARDVVRYSNAFIVKARAKGGKGLMPGISVTAVPPAKDPIAGYFLLPPSTIQIARDANGTVLSYQQEVPGQQTKLTFRPEDVVHIKVNVPSGEAFGLPWLAPVLDDVRLLRKIEENAALLLYRHIFPLLAYTVGIDKPGYEATDTELEQLRSVIEDMPTDGAILLPERHKIEAVKLTAIDGKPYLDYFEQRVFTGMGMSSVDMGRGDTANRNTADAMTGIKADRVKGWQQALQYQITNLIIDELLIEGGFDPVVNPDFAVNFVFNEIEAEMRIKLDTHEIYKFEHNIQTFEETRKNMSMEPVVDESRLYLNMIEIPKLLAGAKTTEAGNSETNNKQQPENQHGKRSGPKRSTESIVLESLKESALDKIPRQSITDLTNALESIYQQMETDVIQELKRYSERKAFPLHNVKQMVSSIYFGKDRMKQLIQKEAYSILQTGVHRAMEDARRTKLAAIDASMALRLINESAMNSIDLIEKNLHELLVKRLEGTDNLLDSILAVKGAFQSIRHRLASISKSILMKTHHYGYALAMIRYGETTLYPKASASECMHCHEKSKIPIDISNPGKIDEAILFHQIPPFHTNCECDLTIHSDEALSDEKEIGRHD